MPYLSKNRAVAGIMIGLLATVLVSAIAIPDLLKSWHLEAADKLYTLDEPSDEIIIIAIDETTTQNPPAGLGRYAQWSRDNYSDLLEVIAREEPKVVAFDVIFNHFTQNLPFEKIRLFKNTTDDLSAKEQLTAYEKFLAENSSTLNNVTDTRLAEQFAKINNLILAFSAHPDSTIFPLPKFAENATLAHFNAELDEDGVLRKGQPSLEVDGEEFPNIAKAVAEKYLGEAPEIPMENGKMNINYFADPFGYKMIPFVDVMRENFEPGMLKNKIVLVGVTNFKEIPDEAITPRSNKIPMPGIETWANQIQTILDQKFLSNQNIFSQILTIAAITTTLAIIFNYLGIILSLVALFVAIGLYIFAAHFFYRQGLIINMVYPFLAIILTYIASWIYRYFVADKKKREIKSAFGHYVSNELVEQISANPDMVKLGGENKEVTVLFSDIKDSTTISEKTDTALWVAQINEYFTVMENVIKTAGGTLDKYEGDAIMCFWNAPISQPDHASRAYAAAIKMQSELGTLNQKWLAEGKTPLTVRIGINTGNVIVGNFGSANRFDYTVMGDTANTASRLESSANKFYGTTTMIAGLKPEIAAAFLIREIDTVLLPGKKDPVTLYELIALAQTATQQEKALVAAYAQALGNYKTGNFPAAAELFKNLSADKPSQIMADRCEKLSRGEIVEGLENGVFRVVGK